jgi:hypothetical protein
MEVLDACYSAGAEVVAILCHMGANDVKALKELGVSERAPSGFRIEKLQMCLIFISLNVPPTFSRNMM